MGKVQLALDEAVLAPELVGARLRHGLGPAVDVPPASDGPSALTPAPTRPSSSPPASGPSGWPSACASVFAGTLLPDRVVVVDNAPDDHADRRAGGRAGRAPSRGCATSGRTGPGLARAHNAALPHVLTPIVAFTDDDVLVDPRWLAGWSTAFADDDRSPASPG